MKEQILTANIITDENNNHFNQMIDLNFLDGVPANIIVAKFDMVSYDQFKNDMLKHLGNIFEGRENLIEDLYKDIQLPKRATTHSAGYDFFAPFSFKPKANGGMIIPTGIRCEIAKGWYLGIYPRSGQGFKYGIHLYNTVGIIDGDYFYADNQGHIMIKISCKEECDIIKKGTAFCQGIFMQYGITVDDNASEIRTGGLGSTTK